MDLTVLAGGAPEHQGKVKATGGLLVRPNFVIRVRYGYLYPMHYNSTQKKKKKGLAQTKRMGSGRTHTHGVANNSNGSVNTSATPALPVKGAELRMGESEARKPNRHVGHPRRASRMTREGLQTRQTRS